jgi:hypothetical protein
MRSVAEGAVATAPRLPDNRLSPCGAPPHGVGRDSATQPPRGRQGNVTKLTRPS